MLEDSTQLKLSEFCHVKMIQNILISSVLKQKLPSELKHYCVDTTLLQQKYCLLP